MEDLQSKFKKKRSERNRKPAYAGQFYPGTKQELEYQLNQLFKNLQQPEPNNYLRAIIAPHAGYIYSGSVAASAYNQIGANTRFKRVFVLASSHHYQFEGAAVFTDGNYLTPLGEVEVDKELTARLTESSELFHNKPEAHHHEHSLEVQLPFLQYKLGNSFSLVPVILGTANPEETKLIAAILKPFFTRENLFVISTDFSHYPEFEDACYIDLLTADAVCTNQPEKLLQTLGSNRKKNIRNLSTSMCGWTSVLTLLHLTKNENVEFHKIEYQNSGTSQLYGDKSRVVGYWSISATESGEPFQISEEEKKEMLLKAHEVVNRYLATGKRGKTLGTDTDGILNQQIGAFVSVYVLDDLRGCIGNFAGKNSLNEVVQMSAFSAAKDERFERLQPEEIREIRIEISVLSPLKKIQSIDEIEIGRHGIYLKKGLHTGTFLPQVALRTGWSLEEFLGHCARDKAGLDWEGWKTAEIFTYEAIAFRG